MHQKPFGDNPTRAKEVLEHVHSDLFELPDLSYHKFKWVMTLLDNYSSFAYVVLLKSKEEAARKMIEAMTLLMNQSNQRIKRFTSDRGGEFLSEELQKYLRVNGIQWTPSAPRTPQQNGHAERLNRTLHEKSQAMRLHAQISNSYWDFAIRTATHVYNCTPMSRLQWKSPFELFMREKPSVNHFRVFGCAAYVYLPDAIRPNKLSAKSELMIFVGYDSEKNFIFIRHTRGNAQFISPTAKFDETYFPRKEKDAIRSPPPDEQIERDLPSSDDVVPIPVPSVENTPDIPSGGAPTLNREVTPTPSSESPIRMESPLPEADPDVIDDEPLAPVEPPRINRKQDLSPPADHYDQPESPVKS